MKTGFRQSMAWLHTWAGLLPGWVLFVIFLFGTTAFFRNEISQWMRPEMQTRPVTPAAVDAAGRYLAQNAPDAASWSLSVPSARGGEPLSVYWEPREPAAGQPRAESGETSLDPATGRPLDVRDTQGGWFLYRFHFDLHYMPVMWARYIVSVAALAMLVALLSGIVTHKKIFTDFFLLRFGKGQRSWLDAHNVTAVMATPFFLMITYTGLVTLLFTLMPWAITASYRSEDAYYAEAYPSGPEQVLTGRAAPVLPLATLFAKARETWGGAEPGYVNITNPGDAGAVVEMYPNGGKLGDERKVVRLNAATGAVLAGGHAPGAARMTQTVMVQLHIATYADIVLRWLHFLAGVGGVIMTATGLVLWTVKRRAKLPDPAQPYFGFRLVEKLNIGVITGSLAGIAVYFLANRLLPIGLAERAQWEINSLFITWGAILAWGIGRPSRRAWVETLAAGGVLYALVPVVNAITTSRGPLSSLAKGDLVFVSFDLVMLVMAGALLFAARKAALVSVRPSRVRTPRRELAEVSA